LIQSSSFVPADGNYVFKNVGTGQIVQHDRKNDVPNIYTATVELKAHAPLELRSHGTRTKWISIRTTASAGDPKCISAQWGYHTEGGADHAGTLYECVVDPLNLEATLEKPKQWWLMMPVDAAKKLEGEQTLDLKNEVLRQDAAKKETGPILSRIVEKNAGKDAGSSDVAPLEAPFWNPKTSRIENFSSAPITNKNKRSYDDHSSQLFRAQQLDLLRRRQLANRFPADPLVNSAEEAPDALNAAQDDQQDALAHRVLYNDGAEDPNKLEPNPIQMLDRRAAHHPHSKPPHQKEAQKPSSSDALGPFYVVSVDHLYDMETRVWTSGVKKTVGNQLSLVLKKLDPNDTTQQWYLELQA